jgi:uncharacterized membrane protein
MEMVLLAGMLFLGLPIVLSVAAFVIAVRSHSRQQGASFLGGFGERLERRIEKLESEVRALREQLGGVAASAAPAPPPAAMPSTGRMAPPAPAPEPAVTPPSEKAADAKTAPPLQEPKVVAVPGLPPQPSAKPAGASATPVTPGVQKPIPDKARPAEPPEALPRPPLAPPFKMPSFDWEALVGVRLFSWIAGIALLLGAIFFLKYSMDQGWLMPPVRMAIGALAGIALLVLCELRAARKYPVTADAMDASAIAILFSTFFAAHSLWRLIGSGTSFFLLVLVTAVAVLLSIRRDSLFIALLGLMGGFSTPFLLSTGENRPIPLFSYILLLNAGLAWVAAKKKWPLLTALSLVLTALYQWGWVMKFLTSGQLPLAVGIFLVFPILAFVTMPVPRKDGEKEKWGSLYGKTADLSALLPLLFAFYMASVSGYGGHYILLFSFLFLIEAGLFAIALARGREILHLAGGLSTLIVFAVWFLFSYQSGAWPAILAFIALFVLFHLSTPWIARRLGRSFTNIGNMPVLAAPLLLFTIPALAAMEPRCADPGVLFGVLFVLLAAASVFAILEQRGEVYCIAAFASLAAEAVWSSRHLTAERLIAALALYAVFGLFYIGVPLAARRRHKPILPQGFGAVFVLVSIALLFFLGSGPAGGVAIWGLGLLLLLLNLGLFLEGSVSRFPRVAIIGIVLSWLVLGYFWSRVAIADIFIPALVVVACFALLAMAGLIWMQKRATGDDVAVLGNGMFLGLAGHLFLLAVASENSLAVPPWPMLGVLLVLDLALGVASLYTRRHEMLVAAIAASAFILMVWVGIARMAPWPGVAIYSAVALAGFGFLWLILARRIGIKAAPFASAAACAVFLAQVTTIVAAQQHDTPGAGFLLAVHLAFLVALLGLAWVRDQHRIAVMAVLPTAAAVSLWFMRNPGPESWQSQLLFAGLIYLVFVTYPLLLGRRARQSPEPYLAAILASVPFFFQARHTILEVGRGDIIGILPVIQAILMAALLVRLLGIEPPGARALGRLAVVAGTALAFVTVAIPLQLEKNWITIAWALEGAALAWLFRKIPHRGLLYASAGLLATAFVRLSLNPYLLVYAPRGTLRIWNWYLYTYLVTAAAMIMAGWLLAGTEDRLTRRLPRASKLLPAGGALLLFLLLNIEIADFYSIGEKIEFHFSATLAQDLTYTLGWAVFAVITLSVGILLRSRPSRIAALALLAATILKCFLHDLARLGGLYRVMSFVGLALCLTLVAVALQKFVLSVGKEIK